MAEGFFSLTPGQADLVRVVAELQVQGRNRITLEALADELDCLKSTALRLARGAADRGWLVPGTVRAPGVRLVENAPVERLFAHQWESGLALTGAGLAALAGDAAAERAAR